MTSENKKNGKTFKWMLSIVVIAGLGGGGAYLWKKKNSKTEGPSFKEVQVSRGDIRISVLTTGTVQPENRLLIKPPINGRIESAPVKEGDVVKKGQILAWMSSIDRAALLDVARAKGDAEVQHWEDLYKPAPIVAPMNGVVIAKNVEPGQTINAQDSAFILSDHLIIMAQVDETDMARIKLGAQAEITLDAYPKEKILGNVSQIAFEARTMNNVTIYDVHVAPTKVPPFMRSGMTANVSFLVSEKTNVLLLPVAAVKQENESWSVTIPKEQEDGQKASESKPIETGLSDGKVIEIVSGIEEGATALQPILQQSNKDDPSTNPFSPFGGGKGGARSGGGNRKGR